MFATEIYQGKSVPNISNGNCLDPELPETGPELEAVEGGGQAETGPGPPCESGDSSRDPAEMEETWLEIVSWQFGMQPSWVSSQQSENIMSCLVNIVFK